MGVDGILSTRQDRGEYIPVGIYITPRDVGWTIDHRTRWWLVAHAQSLLHVVSCHHTMCLNTQVPCSVQLPKLLRLTRDNNKTRPLFADPDPATACLFRLEQCRTTSAGQRNTERLGCPVRVLVPYRFTRQTAREIQNGTMPFL